MTIVWLLVFLGVLVFAVVVLCHAGAFTAAVLWTPVREIVRLCKSNQKKKALSLAASIAFAAGSISLLIWLLSL